MSTKELAELIRQLPPGYQTIFNLHAIEGYSHVEIGRILGIKEGTSRSQYARSRSLLITWINKFSMTKKIETTYARPKIWTRGAAKNAWPGIRSIGIRLGGYPAGYCAAQAQKGGSIFLVDVAGGGVGGGRYFDVPAFGFDRRGRGCCSGCWNGEDLCRGGKSGYSARDWNWGDARREREW
jgi:hypothetical protein